jgi:hypothetical protein
MSIKDFWADLEAYHHERQLELIQRPRWMQVFNPYTMFEERLVSKAEEYLDSYNKCKTGRTDE